MLSPIAIVRADSAPRGARSMSLGYFVAPMRSMNRAFVLDQRKNTTAPP
jgi:hypothetical protein